MNTKIDHHLKQAFRFVQLSTLVLGAFLFTESAYAGGGGGSSPREIFSCSGNSGRQVSVLQDDVFFGASKAKVSFETGEIKILNYAGAVEAKDVPHPVTTFIFSLPGEAREVHLKYDGVSPDGMIYFFQNKSALITLYGERLRCTGTGFL